MTFAPSFTYSGEHVLDLWAFWYLFGFIIGNCEEPPIKSARRTGFVSNTSFLPLGDEKTRFVQGMFDDIANRYDLLNSFISLGLDTYWRRRTLDMLLGTLEKMDVVLDLACGTGDFMKTLSAKNIKTVGVDLSLAMMQNAKLDTGNLIQARGELLPIKDESISAVVSGFALRNFTEPELVLREVFRILIPGGRIALLDVGQPGSALISFANNIWFKHAVPLIGKILSDKNAYDYLPRSVAYLPSKQDFQQLAAKVGFSQITHREISGGLVQVFLASKSRTKNYPKARVAINVEKEQTQ